MGSFRRIATVFRAGLRANFGLAVLKHRLCKERKDRWLVPVFGLAALGVVPLFYGIVQFVRGAYGALAPMGQERAILSLGFLAGQVLILLFGIYYVVAAFYFSRDLEFLIPLPLRPGEVMTAKFAVVVVNEYLTVAAVVLPIVITYGVLARGGVGYWAAAALVYLALPIIPLAIVSVAVVVMMRLINVSRKKDALILVGSIVLVVLVLALQVALGRSAGGGPGGPPGVGMGADAQAMAAFFASPDSLLNRVGAFFPPAIWATKAVAGGLGSGQGLAHLALLWGVSLVLFAGMVLAAEKLFYRGVIGLGETTSRRRRLTRSEMARRVGSGRRAVAAVFVREWRLMNRTPIFLLNGIFTVVLIPAIFIVMMVAGPGGGGGRAQGGADPTALLRAMASADPLIVILGTALFMTICGSINGTASSTFSREGAQFWISKVIPVAPRKQAAAKFLHSYLVAALGVVTAGVVGAAFLRIKAVHLAAGAGLALVVGAFLTAVGMIIDLARPLLDWANPQKAIKQNLNVLLSMIADIAFLTAAFFGVRALVRAGLGKGAVLGIVFVALAVLAAASTAALLRFADRRYRAIE